MFPTGTRSRDKTFSSHDFLTALNFVSDLVGLLVSGHHPHSFDEGVPRVVHAGLDGLVHRVPVGSGLVAQLSVDGGCQVACHAVIVFAQVRVLSTVQTQDNDYMDRCDCFKFCSDVLP